MAMLLSLMACTSSRPLHLIALVDYSGSTARALPGTAALVADTVLGSLGPNDRLTVLPIDGGSVQTPLTVIDLDLGSTDFTKADDGYAHAAEKQEARRRMHLDSLRAVVRQRILAVGKSRQGYANETDLIGAMRHVTQGMVSAERATWVQRLVSMATGARSTDYETVVVVFSDMVQEGEGIDFSRGSASAAVNPERIVATLRKAGRMPEFQGARVFVMGATASDLDATERIRAFWQAFFVAGHATLVAYDFDTAAEIHGFLTVRLAAQ